MHTVEEFQNKIGIRFSDEKLLLEALTHRSYLNENASWEVPHNERLEFLGDAVLELIITENLFKRYPQEDEGKLTSVRATLVNYIALAKVAYALEMEKYLFMSRGEAKDTGRAREVILANACEALIGAIYLDQGYETVAQFILAHVFVNVDEILDKELFKDSKSYFQELAQEHFKITPSYKVLDEQGPDHKKVFVVGVFLKDRKVAEGEGYSKQEAEIEAAKKGLDILADSFEPKTKHA